jgi:hypothetical protein
MSDQSRGSRIGAVLVLGLMVASCAESPTSPTQPGGPRGTSNPAPVSIIRLEIRAPASIAPDQSAKLIANAVRSDGSVENVTERAQWSSADSNLVRVGPGGIATAMQVGEAKVDASYQGPSGTVYGTASVVVLVPGTFKVSGRITDNGTAVPHVAVTVLSGVGEGLTTVSQPDGVFSLYGVGGRTRLQASREGYLTKIEELEITAIVTHNFEIAPDRQRTDLSGNYVLTLRIGACDGRSAPLPSEHKIHQYTATVVQQGPRLSVTLSGAVFIVSNGRGDRFAGTLDPIDNVTFDLGKPDDIYLSEYADLVERVDGTTAFLVYGTVNAKASPTGIVGTLAGSFITADASHPSYWSRSGWCYSAGHLFEMRR